jgi:ribonuclease HI
MISAYSDGGGNNKTKKDFYGSFVVEGHEIKRFYYDLHGPNIKTTNEAEYQTLILLLEYLQLNNISDVQIYSDSMIVVNQINGTWRINSETLKPYWTKAVVILNQLRNVKINWVSRKIILKELGH